MMPGAALDAPDAAGKFSLTDDWLPVIVVLALLALALTGQISKESCHDLICEEATTRRRHGRVGTA
jgi:hypothetical protein